MHHRAKKSLVAALALAASAGMALPAAASPYHHVQRTSWSHHRVVSHAWHAGYERGFRDGHIAAATGMAPDDVQMGRSAYVEPGPAPIAAGDPGVLGNGGLLGTGVLGGNGVLGSGVLDGQGALGLGVLGF